MVRCIDCGLLGVTDEEGTGLLAIGQLVRTSGKIPGKFGFPVCGVLEINILDICEKMPQGPDNKREVLRQERECVKFMKWEPGFTPKELINMGIAERQLHLQMQAIEESKKRDQEHREKLEREQREWQKAQKESDRKIDRKWQITMLFYSALLGFFFSSANSIFKFLGDLINKFVNPN